MTEESFIIKEVLRYTQMPYDKAEDVMKARIAETYQTLKKVAKPRWTYQCLEVTSEGDRVTFHPSSLVVESKDLVKLLANSTTCYLLAATLGLEADRLIHQTQMRDMSEALFLDACANTMIEIICDEVEQELATKMPEGTYMTMRYSPGYGDVPLDIQEKLLAILNTHKTIGLTASKHNLLLPLKSVTAFIGVSSQKEKREKSCASCMMQAQCMYRKRGDVCGC